MNNPRLDKLRSIRCSHDLSTASMARILGISQSMYSYIELGSKRLSYDIAVKLADYFKMTPDELFYEDFMKLL